MPDEDVRARPERLCSGLRAGGRTPPPVSFSRRRNSTPSATPPATPRRHRHRRQTDRRAVAPSIGISSRVGSQVDTGLLAALCGLAARLARDRTQPEAERRLHRALQGLCAQDAVGVGGFLVRAASVFDVAVSDAFAARCATEAALWGARLPLVRRALGAKVDAKAAALCGDCLRRTLAGGRPGGSIEHTPSRDVSSVGVSAKTFGGVRPTRRPALGISTSWPRRRRDPRNIHVVAAAPPRPAPEGARPVGSPRAGVHEAAAPCTVRLVTLAQVLAHLDNTPDAARKWLDDPEDADAGFAREKLLALRAALRVEATRKPPPEGAPEDATEPPDGADDGEKLKVLAARLEDARRTAAADCRKHLKALLAPAARAGAGKVD